MSSKSRAIVAILGVAALLWTAPCVVIADEDTDKAFDALKTYQWGQDRSLLQPIDDAVVASSKDPEARKQLETRLADLLSSDAPQAAKDYVCRKLSLIGSAASVPALAPLLTDEKLSHMARYALERMPCEEAVAAMREALGKTSGRIQVGVINSLGVRADAKSTEALVKLLDSADEEVAAAAAAALGNIGTTEAAKALGTFNTKAPQELKLPAADAYLTCAEKLLAAGNKLQAMAIYQSLSKSEIKHVSLAAKRGMVAAVSQK